MRKFWNLIHNEGVLQFSEEAPNDQELKLLHTTIKKVTDDIERFSLNTTISNFMICVNELKRMNCNKKAIIVELVKLIAPFAPFIAEEMWLQLEGEGSVHHASFPKVEEKYLIEDTVVYPICVNGKKRDELEVAKDTTPQEIEKLVFEKVSAKKWLDQPIKKVIVVPGRMINLVV